MILFMSSVYAKQSVDFDTQALLTADKEALKVYESGKSSMQSISILNKASINKVIKNRPKDMKKEKYVDLLINYARYHMSTPDDIEHGNNLYIAKQALMRVENVSPNDRRVYKILGDLYMDQRHYSDRAGIKFFNRVLYHGNDEHEKYGEEGLVDKYKYTPYKAKKSYEKYVQLCKKQGTKPKLSKEAQLILKRDHMFFVTYSTFTGKGNDYMLEGETFKYKEGFENICQEYINILNTLPDNNLTECSRYISTKNSEFRYLKDSEVSKNLKKDVLPDAYFKDVNGHLFEYKHEQFIDQYNIITLVENGSFKPFYDIPVNMCLYSFVNFTKERQSYDNCSLKQNYRKTYNEGTREY